MSILSSFNQSFTSITADSRKVQAGSLFLAYPGLHNDGRQYIAQAIQAGASAVIWEQVGYAWNDAWSSQVSNLAVQDLKQHVGRIAAEFYQNPSSKLTMVGVTGTNGKTSVSQWLAQCLTLLGKKTAVLGTIGNGFLGAQTEAANTTPDAILLQAMLADYVEQQADAVAMEVSSHGLDQGRVNGVSFDVAVLTNLSRDHLDYHETIEAYAAAKQKLFAWEGLSTAIINIDDAFGQSLTNTLKAQAKPYLTYGLTSADVQGSELKLHDAGLTMQVSTPQGSALFSAPVLGRFNAYNVLAVLTTLLALEVSLPDALDAIANIKPVLGRMQQFGGGALPLVVIDYAHTPDALEKVLSTLKEQIDLAENSAKLICVFGCGGDRDAGKRPLMGNIASKLADQVYVTSDNPRSENPATIIAAVVSEMKAGYVIDSDRANAINAAILGANAEDIVLVAGKGHENYQEISGVKLPFDDALIAQAALKQYQAKSRNGVAR
ncbi:MAG: UDP-N-acetylmuramoyl-L-alanyl-D-glutamate--2,6-diaminopimelate ligase [Methylotenera sp.]|uniref:UDP-N-acetylmuramoyl-L-alanyl-D-glutamate--2, 6-diaminopimelate ligase n=1 Tax=Methylotenera sp. TaxID=2051956 RepID=UPI00248A08A8|nr:UDP-N-acetylmuramoyl-L-alanyl-D-glutamate--2,6-diaminopimelate ligase [Methylotenera sp.]MDI1309809.1 UDP-N-acetylmuramoyl-L-alanyl-D-glutamate--2,6-diaminopimelate ligase [Methylotenera sp.]